MRRGPRREEPALLGHPDRVAPSEMPSFRSMDRTWLVAVLTATVSSSAISPPLSRVGGARARRASARSTVPESPSARYVERRRAAARTACRPPPATRNAGIRRSSPQPAQKSNDAGRTTPMASPNLSGRPSPPDRFRVVGLYRGLGLDEVHLDLGAGISAATIGSAGVTRRRW